MIKLYNGNALDILHNWDGPLIDAVITDPPYASGGATLTERQKTTANKYTGTKRACPFPDFLGDAMDQRSWTNLMRRVLEACRGRASVGAVLCMFVDWRQLPALSDAIQWAGWTWRGTAVWDKINSRPQKGRFRQQTEYLLWASNGPMPADRPAPCLPGVFRASNVSQAERLHQTQKPLEIMRQIVQVTAPGGLIVDPFTGSGTTLEAARLEGYYAVGIEASQEIAATAAKRLGVDVVPHGCII